MMKTRGRYGFCEQELAKKENNFQKDIMVSKINDLKDDVVITEKRVKKEIKRFNYLMRNEEVMTKN